MGDFRQEALELVVSNNYKTVVELGVWKGELSRMFYAVVDRLILIDPWTVYHNTLPEYTCTMGEPVKTQSELDQMYSDVLAAMPKAEVGRMTSLMAAERIPDASVDFVYLDSVHTYKHCKQEIIAWLPKIRPGGMIAGDDYIKDQPHVSRAVDEMFGPQDTDRTWSKRIE